MYIPISSICAVSSIVLESNGGDSDPFRYVGGIRGRDSVGVETCVVGLSTGLLAAAVVASSPTIPALMPLAVEAVLMAFRLGLHVQNTASNIEISPAQDNDSSWSYVVLGKTGPEAQSALDEFHHDKVTKFHSRSCNLN